MRDYNILNIILNSIIENDYNFQITSLVQNPLQINYTKPTFGSEQITGNFTIDNLEKHYGKSLNFINWADTYKTTDDKIVIKHDEGLYVTSNNEEDYIKKITEIARREYMRINDK